MGAMHSASAKGEKGNMGTRVREGNRRRGDRQATTFNAVQMSHNVVMSSGLSLHRWPIGSLVDDGGDVGICLVEGFHADDGALV